LRIFGILLPHFWVREWLRDIERASSTFNGIKISSLHAIIVTSDQLLFFNKLALY